jgi:hypothetical protein
MGRNEIAPHGLCNTGVLYFDSLSLSRFNAALSVLLSNATYIKEHGRDRFIDSLLFTQVA